MRLPRLALICVATTSLVARADDLPVLIGHAGRLLLADDTAVDGTVKLTFRIYERGEKPQVGNEAAIWTADYDTDVHRGMYAVLLGNTSGGKPALTTKELPPLADRFLSVEIGGAELTPRLRLGMVPTAARAALSDLATRATKADLADRATKADAADTAKLADDAKHADEADHAASADDADHAGTSDDALKLGGQTLANLDARFAAANANYAVLANGGLTLSGSLSASELSGVATSLTALNASELKSGTVPGDRLQGTYSKSVTFDNTGNSFKGAFDGVHTGTVQLATKVVGTTVPTDGQLLRFSASSGKWEPATITTSPAALSSPPTCDANNPGAMYFNTVDKAFYGCNGASWQPLANATPNGSSQASAAASCRAIQLATPAAGSGLYWVNPTGASGAAVQVLCDMTSSGGGWTQLVTSVASALDTTSPRQYLYVFQGTWYRSPVTTQPWSWSSGFELPGTYHWFNGNYAQVSCTGSSEKPPIGVGCSNGGGNTRKVIPTGTPTPATASVSVCQDTPNIFGSVCATATVFVREVKGCGTSSSDTAISCEAIRSSSTCTTKGDGVYWLNPGNATIQAYCDMTTDGGGWALVHKTNMANANDRTDSGTNVTALLSPTIDQVAVFPRATMNLLGGSVRVLDSTGSKRLYFTGAPYYTTDSHPFNFYAPQTKISFSAAYSSAVAGNAAYNTSHGICVATNAFSGEHICAQRWCCGAPNNGIWMNGGSWTGAYYSGATWVK